MYHVDTIISNSINPFLYDFGYSIVGREPDFATFISEVAERYDGTGSPALPARIGVEFRCPTWRVMRIIVIEVCLSRRTVNPNYFWGFTVSLTNHGKYRCSYYRNGLDAVFSVRVKRTVSPSPLSIRLFPSELAFLGRLRGLALNWELIPFDFSFDASGGSDC